MWLGIKGDFYMYELVPKSEYRPVRVEIEQIINRVQDILRNDFTFRFQLVGSGKKHLITRIKNGNKGFDFDYNLILNCESGYCWKPKFAKEKLLNAFDQAICGTEFDHPENSTTSITIKVKDTKNSRIIHSCDFAVIYYPELEDDEYPYFKYIRNNKKKGQSNYSWEKRNFSVNIDYKFEWLKENIEGYWEAIKEEYLKVKNSNKDPNKHSFQLYFETINNLFNNYS